MSTALATMPKGDLVAKFQRMSSTLKNVKEETKEIAERAVHATAGLTGGAISGLCNGWDDEPMKVPGLDIPLGVGLAVLAIGAGVTGLAGNASASLTSLGTGIGAGEVAFYVRDAAKKRKK